MQSQVMSAPQALPNRATRSTITITKLSALNAVATANTAAANAQVNALLNENGVGFKSIAMAAASTINSHTRSSSAKRSRSPLMPTSANNEDPLPTASQVLMPPPPLPPITSAATATLASSSTSQLLSSTRIESLSSSSITKSSIATNPIAAIRRDVNVNDENNTLEDEDLLFESNNENNVVDQENNENESASGSKAKRKRVNQEKF